MKIIITDTLISWLGITKKEIYSATIEIGNNGRYYKITNKSGKEVDVPDWAAKIIQ